MYTESRLSRNHIEETSDMAAAATKCANSTANWINCDAVERQRDKVSGAWVFRGTRVPVAALFENLRDGATIDEFVSWFPGVRRDQVEAVLDAEAAAAHTDGL
jgi:uncharacterized protein (DUF433 family)